MGTSAPAAFPPPPPASPRPRQSKWLALLVLLLVLGFTVFGGYVFAGEPGQIRQEDVPGVPLQITEGVTIFPPEGWQEEERFTDPPGVRLTDGAGNLLVLVTSGADPVALLDQYVAQILEPQAIQLQVSPQVETGTLDNGLAAARVGYFGLFEGVEASLEGEVTVGVSTASGTAVAFDGWAAQGQFVAEQEAVRLIAATADVA